MADASLCFSVYWAGSNDLVASKLVLTQDHARCNSVELQNQVARLVKAEPRNIKILLGSLAGPQLTPVLFPPALVHSSINIEDLPSWKKLDAAWSSLETNKPLKVFVTQHSSVALAVDNMARMFRNKEWQAEAYMGLPISLRRNPVVAFAAMETAGLLDVFLPKVVLPKELVANKQFALAVLSQTRQTCTILQYFSETLRNDEQIVLQAVARHPAELYFAQKLKVNKTFVLKAVSVNGLCIFHAAPHLQQDREIATAAVRHTKKILEWLPQLLS